MCTSHHKNTGLKALWSDKVEGSSPLGLRYYYLKEPVYGAWALIWGCSKGAELLIYPSTKEWSVCIRKRPSSLIKQFWEGRTWSLREAGDICLASHISWINPGNGVTDVTARVSSHLTLWIFTQNGLVNAVPITSKEWYMVIL